MSDDFRSAESVQHWFKKIVGSQPPDEQERRALILSEFCAFMGKSPDELVAFCFLRKKDTGTRFVSVKRREAINESLERFGAEQGWTGKEAVANANVVRSFLIHNGVFIQGPVWTGS